MNESLRKIARNKFAKNKNVYLLISLFLFLALVLVTTLSFINLYLSLLALPIFLLPFLFSCHISSYYLQINQQVNLSSFFSYYLGYFKPQFKGSFRGLASFGKSLLFYFFGMIISFFVVYAIFQNIYGTVFTDAFGEIVEMFSRSRMSYSEINEYINSADQSLVSFLLYVEAIATAFLILSFIYFISYSSLSIYYRANILVGATPIIRLCIANTYRNESRQMKRDWWALNWPLLSLALLGIIGVFLFDILLIKDVLLLPSFVVLGSVILSIFYLPYYFPNMEAMYDKYQDRFKTNSEQSLQMILERLKHNINLSEEEIANIEAALNKKEENSDQERR